MGFEGARIDHLRPLNVSLFDTGVRGAGYLFASVAPAS